MRTTLSRLIVLLVLVPLVSGCLLTLGAPLTRKVQPDSWVLEAAAGGSSSGGPGFCGYLYAGKSLGSHFEIGLLPHVYSISDGLAAALTVPIRWDPLPNDWQVHLVPFLGPTVFGGKVEGVGATGGVGLSWQPLPWLEFFAVGSALIPYVQLFTAGGGARVVFGDWQVGASLMYSNPGLVCGFLSAGLVLGGH
jgi:hypothetical protein